MGSQGLVYELKKLSKYISITSDNVLEGVRCPLSNALQHLSPKGKAECLSPFFQNMQQSQGSI